MPEGKLVKDQGVPVCVSCYAWNCWHPHHEPCDIRGCECPRGNNDGGAGDRAGIKPPEPSLEGAV